MKRARRRILATVALVGLTAGVLLLPSAGETDAAWVDAEHATGTFTARVQPMPIGNIMVATCSSPWLGGNLAYRVTWTIPANAPVGTTAVWTPPAGVDASVTPVHLGNGKYEISYSRDQLGWDWGTRINREFRLHMVVNGVSSSPRTLPVVRDGITGDPNCQPIS